VKLQRFATSQLSSDFEKGCNVEVHTNCAIPRSLHRCEEPNSAQSQKHLGLRQSTANQRHWKPFASQAHRRTDSDVLILLAFTAAAGHDRACRPAGRYSGQAARKPNATVRCLTCTNQRKRGPMDADETKPVSRLFHWHPRTSCLIHAVAPFGPNPASCPGTRNRSPIHDLGLSAITGSCFCQCLRPLPG
jgi:hypothetical protein